MRDWLIISTTVFCCLLLGAQHLFALDADAEFKKANDAFQAKNYAGAIASYEAILKEGLQSDGLFYNLGNAYLKNGDLGKAILNYEKTLLQYPRHKEARYNLEIANARAVDEISALPVFFLKRWWRGLRDSLPAGGWGLLTLLASWLSVGGVAGWLLYTQRRKKKWSFLAAFAGLFLIILFFTLGLDRSNTMKDSGYAILLQKELPLRSAPDGESAEVLVLHEGTKVEILDQISDWNKIKLVNGEQGWLPISALGKIAR